MTVPRVSVVIPTYQRRDSLLRALAALAAQSLPPEEFEVVVVVDGSSDGTREAAQALAPPYALRVLWQSNRGRASACNAGVAAATGELIVILDDDMVPIPDFLAAHVRAHASGDARAVIGAAPVTITPGLPAPARYVGEKFNRHLEHLARAGGPVTLRDFYGGNLSVRREVLRRVNGFDEGFTIYGNEDLELSIRLSAAGVRLVYDPTAIAIQHYDKDFAGLARDNVSKGRTAMLLARKHPSARGQLKLGTWRAESLARRLLVSGLLGATRVVPATRDGIVRVVGSLGDRGMPALRRLYPIVLDYLYWCGVHEAQREQPARGPT